MAVLGLRYFRINLADMLGQPRTNPRRVAFKSVEILGLHKDWCANMTELTRVRMECVNVARSILLELSITPWFSLGFPAISIQSSFVALMGSIHKSVDGSLLPRKITFLLYITSQLALVNTTVHPALHSTWMPINDAIVNLGTMCPVKVTGRPGIVMSHMCVDFTLLPSGKLIVSGHDEGRKLLTGVPSMIKMDVAPVSAIAWSVIIVIALRY